MTNYKACDDYNLMSTPWMTKKNEINIRNETDINNRCNGECGV